MKDHDYLGQFEQLVLFALMRLGENAYGMTVRREIEERAERPVSIGAVYATLERLEAKRYVSSKEGPGGAERGGNPKRFFKLEGLGRMALSRSQRQLQRMADGLPMLEWI